LVEAAAAVMLADELLLVEDPIDDEW
jgi:hypothetical protein